MDMRGALALGYCAIFGGALMYLLFNWSIEILGAAKAGLLMYLQMLFVPFFAYLLLGEKLQPYHFVGGALILLGIVVIVAQRQQSPLHPEDAEARLGDRRVERRRESEAQHIASFGRRDDAVIPKPRSGIIGIAFAFILLADRRLERLFLGRPSNSCPRRGDCRRARWQAQTPPARRPSPKCGCWAR